VEGGPLKYVDPDGREIVDYYSVYGITVNASDSSGFLMASATTADALFLGGLSFRAVLASATAELGPAGLVVLAGGGGYLVGYGLNQVPWISATITAGAGVLIEPWIMAETAGGGKTGRKASKHAIEQGQRLIEETRKKLAELRSKRNKSPEDKELINRTERELKRLLDRLRKSEEHARVGQGN
jgi:hypothetical protein